MAKNHTISTSARSWILTKNEHEKWTAARKMRGCPFAYSREIGSLVKVHGEAGAGGQEREAQEEHASKENAR